MLAGTRYVSLGRLAVPPTIKQPPHSDTAEVELGHIDVGKGRPYSGHSSGVHVGFPSV